MKHLAILILAMTVMTRDGQSQEIVLDVGADVAKASGYFQVWDSVQDRLILYRDVNNGISPGVRLIDEQGHGVTIFPLKDLAEAHSMNIWSAAATPEGGVALSAIVSYAQPGVKPMPIRSLLLTYAADGSLIKVWDVAPYHHMQVAVDKSGNVYALGIRDSKAANYPMLVKYSPEGEVLRGFLPANTFASGDSVVSSVSGNGENRLSIQDEELRLWLPETKEFFRFSLTGKLIARVSFDTALQKAAAALGSASRLEILRVDEQGKQFVMQLQVWPKDKRDGVQFAMATASLDGIRAKLLGSLSKTPSPGRFIGTTSTSKLVFLEEATKTTAIVRLH